MTTINPKTAGLALGSLVAACHLLWSLLVAFGGAQFMINWVFRLHFIKPPFTVGHFSLSLAVGLVVVTFVVGYVMGSVFAVIWNKVHKP